MEHREIEIRGFGDKIWLWIPCPKKNGAHVSWDTCLSCSDAEKHEQCPLLAIRADSTPRGYKPGIYHCTETKSPRRAWFNRTTDYVKGWFPLDTIDFFIGKSIHDRIQKFYPRHITEVRVWKDYKDPVYGDFKGTGSVDVVDTLNALLLEIKSIMSLKWVIARGKPIDDHVYQANVYYEWGMYSRPDMFEKLKQIKIVYICKTKYGPTRYKEFDEPFTPPLGLEQNIRALHKSIMTGIPPKQLCKGLKKPTAGKFPCGWCNSFEKCLEMWKNGK